MASAGETLSVVIGANADPLIQGLKQAESALNNFGRTTQTAMNSVKGAAGILETLLGVSLSGGLAALTKRAIDNVGALKEQADQLGINVENYQALKFAAEQAGVSGDDFTTGLNRLSRQLGEAQAGVLKSEDIFNKWGIAVRDSQGHALNLEQVLAEVSDRFKSISDPQLRSAAAMDLMGRSAFSMINFLSQGSGAMAQMEQKARDMGAVIGADTVDAAKKAKDELAALSDVISANLGAAIIHIIPSAQQMNNWFVNLTENAKGLLAVIKLMADVSTDPRGAVDAFEQTMQDNALDAAIKKGGDIVNIPSSSSNSSSSSASGSGAGSSFTPGNPAAARALDDYLKKLQNLHDMNSLTAKDQAVQAAVDQAETIARTQNVTVTEQYIDAVKDAAAANYDQAQQVKELTQLSDQFSNDVINQFQQMTQGSETFGQALRNLALDVVNLLEKMVIQQPLQQAFQQLLGGSGGGSGVLGAISSLFGIGNDTNTDVPTDDLPDLGNALDTVGFDNFGGFFAAGGQPPVGLPSVVGEDGPELFVPRTAGTIVPNSALGANTLQLNQNVNITTGVQATVRAEIMNMLPQIANASKAAVADGVRRGGKFSKAITG